MLKLHHWVLLGVFEAAAAGMTAWASQHDQFDPETRGIRTALCLLCCCGGAFLLWAAGVAIETNAKEK